MFVFIASSIIWMALPIHKKDYKNPGEKEGPVLEALRTVGLEPGLYFFPHGCHGKPDEAMQQKIRRGPWASISVYPGMPHMGKMLGLWLLHLLIMNFLVAYITMVALHGAGTYLEVFRVAGAAAFIAYAGYSIPLCVWHSMPWSNLPGRIFDGVVYTCLVAGSFGWLAPHAPHLPV